MTGLYLFEQPPVTHPTYPLIPGCSSAFCQVNVDSLASSAISIVLTIGVMLVIANRMSDRVPGKVQVWVETFYGFLRGQQASIDEKATFIVPLAMTIFFYILIANWIGFFPLPAPLHPASSDLNQTAAMAVVAFLVVEAYSLKVLGVRGFLRKFTKPFELPWWARYTVFLLINVIEEIAKPLTLALRLYGNIFGGLLMLWVLAVLIPAIPLPVVPYVGSVILVALWKAFDVGFIGLLQAFIFAFLTVVYFELAREGLEHEAPAQAAH